MYSRAITINTVKISAHIEQKKIDNDCDDHIMYKEEKKRNHVPFMHQARTYHVRWLSLLCPLLAS